MVRAGPDLSGPCSRVLWSTCHQCRVVDNARKSGRSDASSTVENVCDGIWVFLAHFGLGSASRRGGSRRCADHPALANSAPRAVTEREPAAPLPGMRIEQSPHPEARVLVPALTTVSDDGGGVCEHCGDRLERGNLVVPCLQGRMHSDCAEGVQRPERPFQRRSTREPRVPLPGFEGLP